MRSFLTEGALSGTAVCWAGKLSLRTVKITSAKSPAWRLKLPPAPTHTSRIPPIVGPRVRITAQPVWRRPSALGESCRGTRSNSTVWRKGVSNARPNPFSRLNIKRGQTWVIPASKIHPIQALIIRNQALVNSMSLRRDQRSMTIPTKGENNKDASVLIKLNVPNIVPEPVRSYTNQPMVTPWIQLAPLARTALINSPRKLGCRSTEKVLTG